MAAMRIKSLPAELLAAAGVKTHTEGALRSLIRLAETQKQVI
jgi:hypothetical protein